MTSKLKTGMPDVELSLIEYHKEGHIFWRIKSQCGHCKLVTTGMTNSSLFKACKHSFCPHKSAEC